MHGCIINTVATAALVLKHQATSIHSADYVFTVLDQFHKKILQLQQRTSETEITFLEKYPVV